MGCESAQTIEDAKELVQQGEQFDFTEGYDYPTMLTWIKNVAAAIASLGYEREEFRLYCDGCLDPKEKVKHCLLLLKGLLLRFELEKWFG